MTVRSIFRLVLGVVAGALIYASHQPVGITWAAVVGVALLYAAVCPWAEHLPSAYLGAAVGFTHSLCVYFLLLPWIGEFVGAMPYIALVVFLSLSGIIMGVGGVWVASMRYGWLLFPGVYVAVEWLRSSYPFGGFAWVRLAWGQVGGPLAVFARIGGPALVTFVTVAVGCASAAVVVRHTTKTAALVLACFAVITLTVAHFRPSAPDTGSVTAAAVQGNVPQLGLEFNAQRRAVLANHVTETRHLSEAFPPVDVVIWPENSADVNPFTDAQSSQLINQAVTAAKAPILVGTITAGPRGPYNTMVVFDPTTGVGEHHNKKFLQPFGEYMPWRSFFRRFSDLVDLAGNFQPGSGTGVVTMTAATTQRQIRWGVATCYEVAFDAAGRDAVLAGAEILTTPTNNATFKFTDMTYQQLAMSRMRAIELDRAVVVAATSGVSAIVHPDGTVSQHSEIFEAKTLVETLPLRTTITVAARYGSLIEYALVIMGWSTMIFAALHWRRHARFSEN